MPRPEAPVIPEPTPPEHAGDAAAKDAASGEDGGNNIELKDIPAEKPNEPAGSAPQGTKRSRPRKPPLALTLVAHNKDPVEPTQTPRAPIRVQPRAVSISSYYSSDSSAGNIRVRRSHRHAPSSSDDEDENDIHHRRSVRYYEGRVAFDSEEYWRRRMAQAYVSSSTRYSPPSPPVLPFFWASQIDIELGYWATPWERGLYTSCLDSLPMMVDVALHGLSYTLLPTPTTTTNHTTTTTTPAPKPKKQHPPRSTLLQNKVIYTTFPDQGLFRLDDLWQRLRAGEHTWPPYAINARGGITDLEPTTLVPFPAFGEGEGEGEGAHLPPLALLQSVRDAAGSKANGFPSSRQTLARDRLLELASLDLWLARAARTHAVAEGEGNLVSNAPAIVEEMWLDFGHEIMRTREERWSRDGGDWAVRQLAKRMTAWLARTLGGSRGEQFFVWVAFMRAVKVMECVQDGPSTYEALGLFRNDILVYLV